MYTKNQISSSTRQFSWIFCYTKILGLVEESFWSNWKNWNVKLICLMWSTHTYILNTPVKTYKTFCSYEATRHPNVDCVNGHLEIVLIQCVKRWPFINILFPLCMSFVNVLAGWRWEAVRRKSLLQYCDAVSGGDFTVESWGPFQIASVDHLELLKPKHEHLKETTYC